MNLEPMGEPPPAAWLAEVPASAIAPA
jgi:hypothetical protein